MKREKNKKPLPEKCDARKPREEAVEKQGQKPELSPDNLVRTTENARVSEIDNNPRNTDNNDVA